jgi:hypothetical protein
MAYSKESLEKLITQGRAGNSTNIEDYKEICFTDENGNQRVIIVESKEKR